MKTDWRIEAPQLAILVAMFALAAATWTTAPDRLPVQWSINGQVDRYGGKGEGLLLLPLIATGTYLLLRFAPRIDPGRANYPGFSTTYNVIRSAVLVMIAALYGLMHLSMRGRQMNVTNIIPTLVGALFVVIGATLGKLRPNWFIGLRTPWTLSSKTAWVRTHRIGGWLFVVQGVSVIALAPFVDSRYALRMTVFGAVAIAVWAMIYSYLVWRIDPDKVPPAGTTPAE